MGVYDDIILLTTHWMTLWWFLIPCIIQQARPWNPTQNINWFWVKTGTRWYKQFLLECLWKNWYPKWHKKFTILQSSSVAFPNLVADTSPLQGVGVHKFWPKHDMPKHQLNEFKDDFGDVRCAWISIVGIIWGHNMAIWTFMALSDYVNPSYIPLYSN
jgi:hypothetical protein